MHDAPAPGMTSPPPIPEPDPTRLAFAVLMLGNIMLALGPWLVRLADVGPIAAGFWRLALAAPLLLLLLAFPSPRRIAPRLPLLLWGTLAIGGLCFAADLAAWHSGILRTRLANATLFGNISSFLFPLYGFLCARRLPGRMQAAALLLALAGTLLLLGRSYELSPRNLAGDLLCVLAGFLYTGYLIAVGRARATLGSLPTLTFATLFGIGPLLLFALGMGEPVLPRDWTPLLLLALGSQVLGQGCMVYAVGLLSPLVVGLALLSQPIVSGMVGWFVYGERLGGADLAGAAAIAIALVLVRRPEPALPAEPMPAEPD